MNKYAKKSVADILFHKEFLSREQVDQAELEAKNTGWSLFRILPQMGFITEEKMVDVISEETDIPRIELERQIIDPSLLELVPEALARKHLMVPQQ